MVIARQAGTDPRITPHTPCMYIGNSTAFTAFTLSVVCAYRFPVICAFIRQRKEYIMTRFTEDAISTLADALDRGDTGGTIYASDARPTRYIVGGIHTYTIPAEHATRHAFMVAATALAVYADHYADRRIETLGFWLDPQGDVVLDLGNTWADLAGALNTGASRGEEAIYDRQTDACINVD